LTKIKAVMHNLQVIKNVAADALDDEGTGGLNAFHAVVDPGSVLEMAAIIEALLGHLEQSGTNPELVDAVQQRLRGGFAISKALGE
jgi:predicted Zn-dependent peptidase